MSKAWKATVVLSVALNVVSFGAILVTVEALLDAQWENLSLFQQLSGDQQALRRELHAATARFGFGSELRRRRSSSSVSGTRRSSSSARTMGAWC